MRDMWRDSEARAKSAEARLTLAREIWNWRPHPAQARFFASSAQVKIAACGRRWGKTESLSLDLATLALTEPGCRQLIVAPTEAQARMLGEETLRRLQTAFDGNHPRVQGRALTVRRNRALTVSLMGASAAETTTLYFRTAGRDGRSLRGLWAHRIVVAEASRVPDSVLTDVLMPMLVDVGGEYVLASSPNGRRSAFYRLYARGEANGGQADAHGVSWESFRCPTTDNPHLSLAFLAAQRDELGEATARQELDAEFVDDFGAVFRADDIDAAIADLPETRWDDGQLISDPRPHHLYTVGIDWGRKVDFTVVAVLDATSRPARLVSLQRWQGMGWDAQAQAVASVCARFGAWRVLADGNSIGDPLAETLQIEIQRLVPDTQRCPQVERFLFGAESKLRLVDGLTLGLSARALCFPAHRVLLAELRGFEYGAIGSSGRARMNARSGGHDDTVMALALAWHAAPPSAPEAPAARVLLGSRLGAT